MRSSRAVSCSTENIRSTDTPWISRCSGTDCAAARQRSSSACRYCMAESSAAVSAPAPASSCSTAPHAVGSWWKGLSCSSASSMRTRSGPARPAACTWLMRTVMAARASTRQPSSGVAANSRLSRASSSSSMAVIQSSSALSPNSSSNSAARSRVSVVAGSRRRRSRPRNSCHSAMRGAKPTSANSETASTSFQTPPMTLANAQACSGWRSSTLSKCLRRTMGRGVPAATSSRGAWRSHSSRRTSHRLRSASGACGSAAFCRAVRSQVNGARRCRPGETRQPRRRRPHSLR